MKEMLFIGGVFFDFQLPKTKQYLYRYFRTDIEQAFLKYFYCFGEYEFFTPHTGFFCQKRWLKELKARHDAIEALHAQAKLSFLDEEDESALARLVRGKFKIYQVIPR